MKKPLSFIRKIRVANLDGFCVHFKLSLQEKTELKDLLSFERVSLVEEIRECHQFSEFHGLDKDHLSNAIDVEKDNLKDEDFQDDEIREIKFRIKTYRKVRAILRKYKIDGIQ